MSDISSSPRMFFRISITVFLLVTIINQSGIVYAQDTRLPVSRGPTIGDSKLRAELVVRGLELPTSMAFLGPGDILVLEKNKGTVQRIINGTMLPEPLLDVNVSTESERGMLGIAVSDSDGTATNAEERTPNSKYVFLYYTQAESEDGEDRTQGKEPVGNRLYRYQLVNDRLVNPKLLLDLPATPGPAHDGGALKIGPDNNLYLTIGDVRGRNPQEKNGTALDGRSGILRLTQMGQPVDGGGILGDQHPLNMYYAYGIRNSFGLDFDPITGKLWDTENGPDFGDEINLVDPGFNSGWREVQGVWKPEDTNVGNITLGPNGLTDFNGKGKYSDPEFAWNNTVGPTAPIFFNSDKLGQGYKNDLFVGDFHNGNLYHFDLDKNRKQLALSGQLADKIANTKDELQDIIFGQGFDGITDIVIGPDGYLYLVSIHLGGIYRIVPNNTTVQA